MNQAMRQRPLVVGMVGGVASGKSLVSQMFQELGAQVISADDIAHQVLQLPEVTEAIVESFGTSILSEPSDSKNRVIDRKKMATLVFGNMPENTVNRKRLEAIVHPRIRQHGREMLEKLRSENKSEFIILDVPLLIEGSWLPWCDKVVFIDTPEEIRSKNVEQRGWTKEHWRLVESSQLPLLKKKQHATEVLVNDGSKELLRSRLQSLVDGWRTQA